MEDQQYQDQFKAPKEGFNEELKLLEKYNNEQQIGANLARMSLYRVFDPLVGAESPAGHVNSPASNHDLPALNNGEETVDTTTTLIHINTPSTKMQHHYKVENANAAQADEHQSTNVNGNHYIMDETISEDQNLKHGTDQLNTKLLSEMALINEQVIDFAEAQIQVVHQQFESQQKETERLSVEKESLIEELNKVEKNYFDTHSRYENMRTIVKQMDAREATNKERIVELSDKLGEKSQECQKWKHIAETQNANLQMQNAAAKETVSLKAQIKVLEMKVNSLTSQISQKNKENEELSHIVEELIGKGN